MLVPIRIIALACWLLAPGIPALSAETLIGLAGPMTGANAVFGEQMREGMSLAVEDLNREGGVLGQPLRVRVGDDACDPRQAVSVANRLATDGVAVVVGHFCSSASIPARAVYTEQSVLQISPASAANEFTDDGNWNVFRTCGRDDQQGAFTGASIAAEFGGKRVAVLHDNSTFGKGVADATRAAMKARGMHDSFYASYTPGERDYTALVTRLAAAGIEVVYIGGFHTEIGLIVRQARARGLQAQFLGPSSLQTRELWQVGGTAVDGLRHTFYADPRTSPSGADIVERFRRRGVDPEGFTLYTYAAVQVWAAAVQHAGTPEPHRVAEALRSGGPWASVVGPISFGAKGDPEYPRYAWYVWHNGNYGPL